MWVEVIWVSLVQPDRAVIVIPEALIRSAASIRFPWAGAPNITIWGAVEVPFWLSLRTRVMATTSPAL